MIKTLSILVPVFNEERTIAELINKVSKVRLPGGIEKELIIVDDGSFDKTSEIVQNLSGDFNFHYIKKEKNQGKGRAIQEGVGHCKGEYTLILDADLEYDPEEINIMIDPVVRGQADVVYGSRFVGGKAHRILFFWHTIGNKFLTFVSNMFTNLNLTDMEVGYKLFNTQMLKNISLRERSFGFEPEVTAKIARIKGVRIYEVGISYYGRTYDQGKKISWKDGVRALFCIVRYNFFSR